MQSLAERQRSLNLVRDTFAADEIGWVGADADVKAVLLGTSAGPLAEAHARIDSLALVASHPRLVRAAQAQLGAGARIAASAYWRSWDGNAPLLPEGAGVVALVFLGWRGKVADPASNETAAAELGAVLLVDAARAARLAAAGGNPVGPFLAVRYDVAGAEIPALSDSCLWPSAWCV